MRRPLALIAALAVAAALLLSVSHAPPAAAAPGTWLSRINGYRASNGLGPVTEDAGLNAVAQAWTTTMSVTGLSHNPLLSQQLTVPWTRFGENVGYGLDEASVFQAFINSPGHRANLLGGFNGVGIGHVVSGGRVWTTHVFVATTAILRPPAAAVTTIAAAGRASGGMWTATNTGTVSARAGAPSFGQLNVAPNRPVVGMTGSPTGNGYWMVAGDGGIFAFGDAGFFGSTGAFRLNQPIVGMAAAPSGKGYWLVASDGGIFAFGDAPFHGSTGSFRLNRPIVGMASTPSGKGYWLVASDGGIFAFGDAPFFGSTGSFSLVSPISGITRSASGNGYRMVASDGGIFSFGDAPFFGSLGGAILGTPVVAMAATPSGRGYWLVKADGSAQSFGDAPAA
jgi:hypothetical protein